MKIPIKPLSVNRCWQGKRFKTKEYNRYCQDVSLLLKAFNENVQEKIENKPYEILYVFWIKNWKMLDIDNPIKPITDILVANRVIPDDRFIMKMSIEKREAKTRDDEGIGFEWRYI